MGEALSAHETELMERLNAVKAQATRDDLLFIALKILF
jgi:hypothetical protein